MICSAFFQFLFFTLAAAVFLLSAPVTSMRGKGVDFVPEIFWKSIFIQVPFATFQLNQT